MGIRFHCPECQKALNVKSHLAGRRGICPKCDARFVVPENDQENQTRRQDVAGSGQSSTVGMASSQAIATTDFPQSGSKSSAKSSSVNGVSNDGGASSCAGKPSSSVPLPDPDKLFDSGVVEIAQQSRPNDAAHSMRPESAPLVPDWSGPAGKGLSGTELPEVGNASAAKFEDLDLETGSFVLDRPSELADDRPNGFFDWIADSPQSVWYVRHKTGAQYGPASGKQMRAWVGQGRVSHTCHVWREGWANWRQAIDVFPQLAPKQESIAYPPQTPSVVNVPATGDTVASVPVSQRSNSTWLFVSILLFLAVVAVIVAFVLYQFILVQSPEESQQPNVPSTEIVDPFA